jgi:hypothetical protein
MCWQMCSDDWTLEYVSSMSRLGCLRFALNMFLAKYLSYSLCLLYNYYDRAERSRHTVLGSFVPCAIKQSVCNAAFGPELTEGR